MRERERAPRGLRWNRQILIGMFSPVTLPRACFEWSEAKKLSVTRCPPLLILLPPRWRCSSLTYFPSWKPPKRIIGHYLFLTAYTICWTPIGLVISSIFCSRRFPKLRTWFFCAGVIRRTLYGVCVRNSSLALSTRRRSPLTEMRRYCSSSRSGVRKPMPHAFTRKRSGAFRNSFRSSAANDRHPQITQILLTNRCNLWMKRNAGQKILSPDKTASPARCYRITAATAAYKKAASQPGFSHNNGCGGRRLRQDHSDR